MSFKFTRKSQKYYLVWYTLFVLLFNLKSISLFESLFEGNNLRQRNTEERELSFSKEAGWYPLMDSEGMVLIAAVLKQKQFGL